MSLFLFIRFILFAIGAVILFYGLKEILAGIQSQARQLRKEEQYNRGCSWVALGVITMSLAFLPNFILFPLLSFTLVLL